ncbi:MAG: hypothetical protein AVDCRST_MAG93-8134, partial [uncultured Chloroflexia bacterium]
PVALGEGWQRIVNGKGISLVNQLISLGCKLHTWVRPPRPRKDRGTLEGDVELWRA